jgi:uncharacterized protein (UPF0212 family)
MYEVAEEFVDTRSGFHVVRLRRDTDGHEHLVQVAIGHSACPACGSVRASMGREVDPKQVVADVIADLEASHAAMLAYAEKHGVKVAR